MSTEGKRLVCVDCGATFIHRATAQKRMAAKGATRDPQRCPKCRQAKFRRKSEIQRG